MTTGHLTKNQLVLAKIESTYGTDPVPTGAANAVLVSNLTAKPLNATLVDRNVLKGYLGSNEKILADVHSQISFDVEIAGSGAAGTAPAFGPLLRACGLDETIVAASSVSYKPVSADFESVTIYYYADGVLHKMVGCRGTVQIDFTVKKIPVMKFSFTALYAAPVDAANPTPTFTGFKTPKIVSNTNTTGFTFNSYAGKMSSFTIDLKNTVVYRTLVGEEKVQITGRESSGTCDFEMPSIADTNVYTSALGSTLGTLALQHGSTAGNICTITSAGVKIRDPSFKDEDGIMMISVPYDLVPTTAGNDELTLAFT